MKSILAAAGLLALGVTVAVAQSNAVEQRQALMKEMGAQSRTLGNMMRGQAPYNAEQVQAGLKVFSENAKKAGPLFAEKTGSEKSAALPAVWETKANFDSIMGKLDQDARTAMSTIKDEATLKTELPKVLQNCGTCHQTYRKS
jgi:cytochrome c556